MLMFYYFLWPGDWVNLREEAPAFNTFVSGEPTNDRDKNCAALYNGQLKMHVCDQEGSNGVCQKGPRDEGTTVCMSAWAVHKCRGVFRYVYMHYKTGEGVRVGYGWGFYTQARQSATDSQIPITACISSWHISTLLDLHLSCFGVCRGYSHLSDIEAPKIPTNFKAPKIPTPFLTRLLSFRQPKKDYNGYKRAHIAAREAKNIMLRLSLLKLLEF